MPNLSTTRALNKRWWSNPSSWLCRSNTALCLPVAYTSINPNIQSLCTWNLDTMFTAKVLRYLQNLIAIAQILTEIQASKVHPLSCPWFRTPFTLALYLSDYTLNPAFKLCTQVVHLTNNTPSKSCLNPTLQSHPNAPKSETQNSALIFLNVETNTNALSATYLLQNSHLSTLKYTRVL